MKTVLLILLIVPGSFCLAQTNLPPVHEIKEEKIDTGFAYSLPYQKGRSHLLVQGYYSKLSHKGEYALDFKMKRGTEVCAARSGVVVSLREDSKIGGLKQKYLSEGNHIV